MDDDVIEIRNNLRWILFVLVICLLILALIFLLQFYYVDKWFGLSKTLMLR